MQAEQLADYLELAGTAMLENRLGTPINDNAIYYLEAALAVAPNDARVKNGFNTIEKKYVELISQAITKANFSKANTYLKKLKTIPFIIGDFSAIESQISQAQKRYNIQQKEKQRLEAIASEKKRIDEERKEKLENPLIKMQLDSNLQAAADLVEQGNLVEPIGNNALEKFNSALEIDPGEQTALSGIKEIETTIITGLDVAVSNKLIQSAEIWMAKLRLFNSSHPKLDDYLLQLEEMKLSSDISGQEITDENKGFSADGNQQINEINNNSDVGSEGQLNELSKNSDSSGEQVAKESESKPKDSEATGQGEPIQETKDPIP